MSIFALKLVAACVFVLPRKMATLVLDFALGKAWDAKDWRDPTR